MATFINPQKHAVGSWGGYKAFHQTHEFEVGERRALLKNLPRVDMDGLLSLNKIQGIPGKKLAISFNGSTITVDEGDVKIVGRVAVVMERV